MQLSLQSFSTLVANMSASAQAACSALTNLAAGSVTRAMLEASASVALWLQYLVLQVMSMTRLATSSGADVDSWVGDFGLARLPGIAATGAVTLTSLSPGSQSAVVPVGALMRTSDATQSFAVTADPANAAWSSAAGAYLRPAGTASIVVPVQAVTLGGAGNVQAGTINLLGQSIPGIDTVTNALPFTTGADAESDAALKARFANYINTRARATTAALGNAVAGVQQGLSWAIEENVDPSGAARPGFVTIVVDDGSGAPPATLLAAVNAAADAVRPVGIGLAVVAPTLVPAVIAITLVNAPGSDATAIAQAVTTSVTAFVDALPVGAPLPISRIAALAYDADPGVTNVTALTVNGGILDIGGAPGQVVRVQSVAVA